MKVHVQRHLPGHVAQTVGHLTRKSGVLGSIPGLATSGWPINRVGLGPSDLIISTFFCTRLISTSFYICRSIVLRLTYTFLITPSELQLILYR